MTTPEAKFWTRTVRPRLISEARAIGVRLHMERVENTVAVGTPDVDYCADGVPGKIELKYAVRLPARPQTPVLGRGKGLRRSQVVWHYLRARSGGTSYVLIGAPGRMWLLPGGLPPHTLRSIELMPVSQLDAVALWTSPGTTYSLLEVLRGAR